MPEREINLPPLPQHLFAEQTFGRDRVWQANDLRAYAREAVLADRASRPAPPQDERERFEAWFRGSYWRHELSKHANSLNLAKDAAWASWQAALAQSAASESAAPVRSSRVAEVQKPACYITARDLELIRTHIAVGQIELRSFPTIDDDTALYLAPVPAAPVAGSRAAEGLDDSHLVERAVRNACLPSAKKWVAVMYVFGLGSTRSKALCVRFGFNPDDSAETAISAKPWDPRPPQKGQP